MLPWRPLSGCITILSLLACAAPPSFPEAADVQTQPGRTRIATYNMEYLTTWIPKERRQNLQETLKSLDADIVAVQEVDDKAALAATFGKGWNFAIADLPEEDQELGVAVREPYKILDYKLVYPGSKYNHAFPNHRDVMRCLVETPGGTVIAVYSVHLRSRRDGRAKTDDSRCEAASLIAEAVKNSRESLQIVMGDFNDTPDDRSANILESGDPETPGGKNADQSLMVNLTEPLAEKDYVTQGVGELYRGQREFKPIAKGAFADNARLRGQNYNFPRDVKVKQIFFDQILATPPLAKLSKKVGVHAVPSALRGRRAGEDSTIASDHLPVVVEFNIK